MLTRPKKKEVDGRTPVPLIVPMDRARLATMLGKPAIIATASASASDPLAHLLKEGEEDMAVTDPCVMTDLE
ncbi:hypothetical protein HYU19_01585 [Candidatus Woesearchaeota archaeon]|nr:hypothetical protein [Candidatus Woesearchaeota archaeon]